MPGQMERFVCRCGKVLLAKAVIQSKPLDRPLVGGQWKFTSGYYALPQGVAMEESYIYTNPYQQKERTKADAEAIARRFAREAGRCGRRR